MAGSNINGNIDLNFYTAAGAVQADFDGQLQTVGGNYELIEAYERHAVAGAAANIQVFKVPSGTAKASGTNMLASAGFAAAGTADTVVVIGPSLTVSATRLVRGDSVAIVASAASAALDGVSVTVRLKALSQLG